MKISILDKAEEDIDSAYLWYEFEQIGLGDTFYNNIRDGINFIAQNPFTSREIYKGIRRYVVRKFPYGIYYQVDFALSEVKIIGIVHFKRSSKIWKKRLKG